MIICFTFPPAPGIGGRRWAKFAKYLCRKGYDIRVLTNNNTSTEASSWNQDIEEYRDKIVEIPSNYPTYLGVSPKSITEKILYRLSLLYVKIFAKGNYYDRGAFWKRNINQAVEKYIGEGFNTIIVSAPPYRVAHHLLDVKAKYPNVQFIFDLRDPWDVDSSIQGFSSLSENRKRFEVSTHEEVVKKFDKIICVSQHMTNFYLKKYPNKSNAFYTLTNGFDKEDYSSAGIDRTSDLSGDNKIKFVYAGSFYPGTRHVLEKLIQTLKELDEDTYHKLQFEFYGNVPDFFVPAIKSCSDIMSYGGYLSLNEVYQKINAADYVMLFLLDDINYSFSTKFYEYISQNKPIVLLCQGDSPTGEYIKNNDLGYFANFGNMKDELVRLVENHEKGVRKTPQDNLDVSGHDVKNITDELIHLIEK